MARTDPGPSRIKSRRVAELTALSCARHNSRGKQDATRAAFWLVAESLQIKGIAARQDGGHFDTFRAEADLGYSAPLACGGCHMWGNTDECQFDVNEGFQRGEPMH
jgi:hypothetical protein